MMNSFPLVRLRKESLLRCQQRLPTKSLMRYAKKVLSLTILRIHVHDRSIVSFLDPLDSEQDSDGLSCVNKMLEHFKER